MKTYAAYYDNSVRIDSSSGGLFSLIASKFDVIYGVAMTNDCYEAEFIRIERSDISPLRGSKYVQAKVGDSFNHVKNDLNNGKKVLFSGTGCQVNGLAMFLGKKYNNLFLLDVVCHGVPSPKLWREYVIFQEKKYGKLINVNFRCKDDSWKNFGMKENQRYISKDDDIFMRMFLRNHCLRPSCHECHAKYYKRADLTIADFWGIEEIAPELNDGKGVSLVIARSDKGNELFDSIKGNLKWKEVSYEEGVKHNAAEYKPYARPASRGTFYLDLNRRGFKRIIKKYASDYKTPLKIRIRNKIKRMFTGGGTDTVNANPLTNRVYGVLYTFKGRI